MKSMGTAILTALHLPVLPVHVPGVLGVGKSGIVVVEGKRIQPTKCDID